MPDAGLVRLTGETCLVGQDGWGDGLLGVYATSDVLLNDFGLIDDIKGGSGFGQDPAERLAMLHALGDEAAAHFFKVLPAAREKYRHVVVQMHVSPFREACWHQGAHYDDNRLPIFSC